jgi:hypothetical protein
MPFVIDEDCQSNSEATTTTISGVNQKHNKSSTNLIHKEEKGIKAERKK